MPRKSVHRNIILQVIRDTNTHPDAGWIYERVKVHIPDVSMGTIYRNLKQLAASGEIRLLSAAGKAALYDGNCGSHYHAVCTKCGKVVDFDEPNNNDIEARGAEQTGFRITGHRLELYGICPDCDGER